METQKIKRALLSVSDKSGLVELAKTLTDFGVELISSGGTASFLKQNGFQVTAVESITGNPEAFGGRMKTMSFQIGSSILYRRDHPTDQNEALSLGIAPIDLVVCHLYPFEDVRAKKGDLVELIENIDIGGPTMLRAAAKNYRHVVVCPEPQFYHELINELKQNQGATNLEYRQKMALKTFRHCCLYDGMIARELEERWGDEDYTMALSTARSSKLRYGENPQQKAYVYAHQDSGLAAAPLLQGKELSYNNLWDADQAFRALTDLDQIGPEKKNFAVCIVKHANPCGLALASSQREALDQAWAGDPVSSFGSIIAFNQEVELVCAKWLNDKFVEVIIAPSFSNEALEIFSQKKNLRLIQKQVEALPYEWTVKSIDGGMLIQTEDSYPREEWKWVSQKQGKVSSDLVRFGLVAAKHLRSNAIALVLEKNEAFCLIGAGMGNPNRLVSIEQAYQKAHDNGYENLSDALLISDAFFPFDDNIIKASSYGIKHFIQPGGSIKDREVIAKVDELGLSMAFTGTRHFRH